MSDERPDDELGFIALTPNGVVVTCSADRWALILDKHPVLRGRMQAVREAIEAPDEIRRSRSAPHIWLCYRRRESRFLCAVIAPDIGLLVTAYPTDAIKNGELVWTPSA